MTTAPPAADREAVRAFFTAMVRSGDVHEVRIPKLRRSTRREWWGVASGYFDNADDCADWLETLSGVDAEGVYLTLNPVNPDLLARAVNRIVAGKPVTTTDVDIVGRRHLLFDFDPVRPTGISATDEQRDQAMSRADEAEELLSSVFGWPPPVARMMTGNGAGLIYRVRLENDEPDHLLVDRVLRGAVELFGDGGVSVDTTVANASRIAKIAGTVAAKGDHTLQRPWRLATAELREDVLPVSRDALEAVALISPQPSSAASTTGNISRSSGETIADRIPQLLAGKGIGFTQKQRGGTTVYLLDQCLTSSDHTDGAAILAMPSGAVAYRCHHNRCRDLGWADAKGALGLEPATTGITFTVGAPATRAAAKPTPEERVDQLDASLAAGFRPAPAICFHGWFGDYARLMGPTSEAPDEFHLGSSLALAASMVGRSISVDYVSETLYPNLYIGLIGRSGSSRKDTAIKRATTLPTTNYAFNQLETPPFRMIRDMSSAQGLIAIFKDSPNVLMYLSELSALIQNARRKSTSTILDALIEIWDTPPTMQNNTKADANISVGQIMTIIAATQPGRLAGQVTDEDIHSGFLNRWLFITGIGKPPIARPPTLDKTVAWNAYTDLRDAIQSLERRSLSVDPSAGERFDAWYLKTTAMTHLDEAESAMRQRHATIAMKVASLFAISDGVRSIGDQHLASAIALVEWSWSEIRPLMTEWGVGINEKIQSAILRALDRRGSMRKRDLYHLTKQRGSTAFEWNRTFDGMVQVGEVEIDGERTVTRA